MLGVAGTARRSTATLEFALPIQNPQRLFMAILFAMALAVLWLFVDAPVATSNHRSGHIYYCESNTNPYYDNRPTWCMVQLDETTPPVQVFMKSMLPGHAVSLIEMRRRITRRTQYVVDYTSKP